MRMSGARSTSQTSGPGVGVALAAGTVPMLACSVKDRLLRLFRCHRNKVNTWRAAEGRPRRLIFCAGTRFRVMARTAHLHSAISQVASCRLLFVYSRFSLVYRAHASITCFYADYTIQRGNDTGERRGERRSGTTQWNDAVERRSGTTQWNDAVERRSGTTQ